MTLWLIRAGKYGEREDFALKNNVAVLGWDEISDLSVLKNRKMLADLLRITYPEEKAKTLINWESQLWPIVHDIKIGDLIALPLKNHAVIAVGDVASPYRFVADNPKGAYHTIPVKSWKEIPRNKFEQDLLYSLGCARTICRIQRHQAEERVLALLAGKSVSLTQSETDVANESDATLDVEQFARDQIIDYIRRKYKGHGLSRLVGAVLEAQGYQVRVSPEGADGGVDILAGRGPLGFDNPRLAVQVKSGDGAIDVSVMRELSGVINNFGADLGLIVSWGGFKSSVDKEAAHQFFKIRLWDADDLVRMIQEYYEKLSPDIQTELPLKRIWALIEEEEQ
jgi:restriction system protein